MKTIITALALFTPFLSVAQTQPTYDCQVVIVADDLPNGGTVHKYEAEANGGSHGGREYIFDFENHKVGVLSNAKWLALSWMRDGKTVGKATYARSEENRGHHVLVLGHPDNENEQVSVGCSIR